MESQANMRSKIAVGRGGGVHMYNYTCPCYDYYYHIYIYVYVHMLCKSCPNTGYRGETPPKQNPSA